MATQLGELDQQAGNKFRDSPCTSYWGNSQEDQAAPWGMKSPFFIGSPVFESPQGSRLVVSFGYGVLILSESLNPFPDSSTRLPDSQTLGGAHPLSVWLQVSASVSISCWMKPL